MEESQQKDQIVIVADTENRKIDPGFDDRLEACLTDFFPDVNSVRILSTPVFVEVQATCPECQSRISCDEVTADARNGARGQMTCTNEECNWSGLGIYRLVDVETPDEGINRSAVLEGEIEPRVTSYE